MIETPEQIALLNTVIEVPFPTEYSGSKIVYEQMHGPGANDVQEGDGWGYGQPGERAGGSFSREGGGVDSSVAISGGNICNTYSDGKDAGTVKIWLHAQPNLVVFVDVTYSISVTAFGQNSGGTWTIEGPSPTLGYVNIDHI